MEKSTNIKLEDLPETMTPDDIANFLHIGKPLVFSMIEENNIPTIKIGKKTFRILKSDFISFIESRK